jgi:5-methylcytosine-specific restriction protein A
MRFSFAYAEAYAAGARARRTIAPACPFNEGTEEAYYWREGLRDAHANGRTATKARIYRLAAARNLGRHTDEEWEQLVEKTGHICMACKQPTEMLFRDHIKPLALGGSDSITNIQPLCRYCNSLKGPKASIDPSTRRHPKAKQILFQNPRGKHLIWRKGIAYLRICVRGTEYWRSLGIRDPNAANMLIDRFKKIWADYIESGCLEGADAPPINEVIDRIIGCSHWHCRRSTGR